MSINDRIKDAILLGSMEGKITWYPTKITDLNNRVAALKSLVKATPFYSKRLEHVRRLKLAKDAVRQLDVKSCKKFYTRLSVLGQEDSLAAAYRYTSPYPSTYKERWEIQFYIDFSTDDGFKVEWKLLDSSLSSYRVRDISKTIVFSEYYMLPSLIPNNIIREKTDMRTYIGGNRSKRRS